MTDEPVDVTGSVLDPRLPISVTGPTEAMGTLSFAMKFPDPAHRRAVGHCLKFYLLEVPCIVCSKPHCHLIVTFYNDDKSIEEVLEDNEGSKSAEYRTLDEAMEAYNAIKGRNAIHTH